MPAIERLIPRGEVAARLDRSLRHLGDIPQARLTRDLAFSERAWTYGADMAGRWLEVVSLASGLRVAAATEMPVTAVVDDLLGYQEADGMLGCKYDSTGWACAGRGLAGLVEAYAVYDYEPALSGARRLVDCFEQCLPAEPAHRGCMGLRDLVRYAEVSRDERGLVLARSMRDRCPELAPDYPLSKVSGNLHLFINVHRGLLRLSGHTGGDELLEQVVRLWAWVDERYHWVSGGVPEWLHPGDPSSPAVDGSADANFSEDASHLARRRDETCTTVDWMLLNLELGQATGEDQYVESAEHTFWNHFLAGQAVAGGWCAHSDLSGQAGEVWDFCCSFHGPMGLIGAMAHALRPTAGGLRVNLYIPVEAELSWDQAAARATLDFDPVKVEAELKLVAPAADRPEVQLRRPRWAADFRVEADGQSVHEAADGGILVSGSWQEGGTIRASGRPRVVIHDDCTSRSGWAAAQRGPLMLAAVDLASHTDEQVQVSCTETEAGRRIAVELDGRFAAVVGLFWVDGHCLDWDDLDRGIEFGVTADGRILASSKPRQGWVASAVIGESVAGAGHLILEARSTHPEFPARSGHFTSVRLLTEDGGIAFLDPVLGGGQASVVRLDLSIDELAGSIDKADPAQPIPVESGRASGALIPFKDLPRVERPEGATGQMIPLAHRDFAVLLPGVQPAQNGE